MEKLSFEEIRKLLVYSATVKPGATMEFSNSSYTAEDFSAVAREQIKLMTENYYDFQANKQLVFKLMSEVIDEVLPKKVFDALDQFVEISTVPEGTKKFYTKREGLQRARNFVTRVSHAGVYEVFKLDTSSFEITTEAYGGAVQISIEEYLEKRIDFGEVMDLVEEGFEIQLYKEIVRQMLALNSNTMVPDNNLISANGWEPRGFHSLLGIARSYAEPTIFTSYQFAGEMIPHMSAITDRQKEEIQSKGYIGQYMGAKVVILPTSFYDPTNEGGDNLTFPIDKAFIMPTGMTKPIKIVLEGGTLLKESENQDWSKEIQMYKKFGVALFANPGICIYENTAISNWPETRGPIFVPASGEVTADTTYKYTHLV